MPNIGLVKIKDSESKQFTWIDTSDKATRDKYKHENYKYENEIINQLKIQELTQLIFQLMKIILNH